jgi:hypothetical protein
VIVYVPESYPPSQTTHASAVTVVMDGAVTFVLEAFA